MIWEEDKEDTVGYEHRIGTVTLNLIPIVRCKDCKFYEKSETSTQFARCKHHQIMAMLPDDWFCADGERRE